MRFSFRVIVQTAERSDHGCASSRPQNLGGDDRQCRRLRCRERFQRCRIHRRNRRREGAYTSCSISATLGTLCRLTLQNLATNSIYHDLALGNLSTERVNTDTLLNGFNVFSAYPNPSCTPQVPPCFTRQVLDHDSAKHSKFCFEIVEDAMVR